MIITFYLLSVYIMSIVLCCFSTMNLFRITGQLVDGVPQRPYLMPPQLSQTASHPCFIMQAPPPNHVIGPIPVDLAMPPPPPCQTPPPPPKMPPLPPPPPPTFRNAPAPVSSGASFPVPRFTPGHAYSVPECMSRCPIPLFSHSTISSPQMNHHSIFKPKSSCGTDVQKASDVRDEQSATNHNKNDSKPSPQSTFADSVPMPSSGFQRRNRKISAPSFTSTSTTPSSSVDVEQVSTSATDHGTHPTTICKPTAKPVASTSPVVSSSDLSISAPVFVPESADTLHHLPAPGYWKSCLDTTAVVDGLDSGSDNRAKYKVSDGIVRSAQSESTAILYSTASLPLSAVASTSSLLSPSLTRSSDGKQASTIGRGRILLDSLRTNLGSRGLLSYLHAFLSLISCMPLSYICICISICQQFIVFNVFIDRIPDRMCTVSHSLHC